MSSVAQATSLREVHDRVASSLVGREQELGLVLAALAAGRDILLDGPPGTSKSTMLKAIAREWGIPLVFVEGTADMTPVKLIGHHGPLRVLRGDCGEETFVDGPLVEAMRTGGILYVEEFNRAPEDALNTLLTAMAQRRITVPGMGVVHAAPTFRIVAMMNPYDNVGTNKLSSSVQDRLCRVSVGYQDEEAERAIVALRTVAPQLDQLSNARLVRDAVAVTRATRSHEEIRQGSSVRGAIDLVLVAVQLINLAGVRIDGGPTYAETFYGAMTVALSGRIVLDQVVDATPEDVLRTVCEDYFDLDPAVADPG